MAVGVGGRPERRQSLAAGFLRGSAVAGTSLESRGAPEKAFSRDVSSSRTPGKLLVYIPTFTSRMQPVGEISGRPALCSA